MYHDSEPKEKQNIEEKIVLKFSDKSTLETSREALCAVNHTWFKQAFCGRYDGLVTRDETDGCYCIDCDLDTTECPPHTATVAIVQYLTAVLTKDVGAWVGGLQEEDAWGVLRAVSRYGVLSSADAAVVRICEIYARLAGVDGRSVEVDGDFLCVFEHVMDKLKCICHHETPASTSPFAISAVADKLGEEKEIDRGNLLSELLMSYPTNPVDLVCGMIKVAFKLRWFDLVDRLMV